MKKTSLFLGKLLLILLILSACQDHRNPPVTPGSSTDLLRLRSISRAGEQGTARVTLFSYDGQNRLSQLLTYQTPDSSVAPVENTTYSYDDQNRLSEVKRRIVRRSGLDPVPEEIYKLTYNPAAQLSEMTYDNNQGDNHWLLQLYYTPQNQPASFRKSFSTGGLSYQEVHTLTFTGKNLTQDVSVNTATRLVPGLGTITTDFSYDSQRNPFYGIFIIPAPFQSLLSAPQLGLLNYYSYFGGIDNLLNLSPNNATSAGPLTYEYTYNGEGLPLTRVTKEGGTVTESLVFTYETY
ncbi:hypothetical protein [Larkinella soli]|uniref:hypothetical protein n=1 Tax=Larkinella soli TaxID=1770527 RepID=UPI000FFB08F3|nr:hypothetical protein [Larkinella soli]